MAETASDPYLVLAFVAAALALPFAIVAVTAFTKVAIVLFLLRNALGIQQTPPNPVLYAIALVLAVYVAAPMVGEVYAAASDPTLDFARRADWTRAAAQASEPVRAFLERFAEPDERSFFVDTTARLWPEPAARDVTDRDLVVLLPAYMVSELTRAFEIGFLLYLPFIIIDLVVTNILTAMGMVMVAPTVISLPVKLFLFVLIDGWTRLTHGLVLSYGV